VLQISIIVKIRYLSESKNHTYPGIVKAGSKPKPISETTDTITALSITIGVELERGEESAYEGHKIDSAAKKAPNNSSTET
jgi:hypothetical protein